ncbi:hypothetical protein HPHPH36_0190 [Helicobacter pylori Hp H-36]|nr:hypothetical protein HPHPH36_0190 [Helicobacter pylori Hp H-36]
MIVACFKRVALSLIYWQCFLILNFVPVVINSHSNLFEFITHFYTMIRI